MFRYLLVCAYGIVFLLGVLHSAAQNRPVIQSDDAQAAWREDLTYMVERLESIHPNLFWRVSEAEFRQQVTDLDAEIPYLTGSQIILRLAALAAHGGGHTYLALLQGVTGFRLYPLRLYWFSDGLFVVGAEDESIIGARVVGVGNASVDTVYEALKPITPNDNETAFWLKIPAFFAIPEVLQGLGFISDVNAPNFLLETPDGEQITYNPAPESIGPYAAHFGSFTGLPRQESPLYLSRPDENFWLTALDESHTLYIQYNAVQRTTQSGMTIAEFSEQIEALVSEQDIQRVVVDLRQNGGGDNRTYAPLLNVLRAEAINQRGRLFVITGRVTFSAAMNFADDMDQQTEALFVGEPTGSRPNHYGDSTQITLPNSGLIVHIATRTWQDSTPDDTRDWIEPDIPASLSSDDYFSGRDPAMEAILAYEG